MTPLAHAIVPYDRDQHEAFVLASWEGRAPAGAPGSHRPPLHDRRVMEAHLRRPDTRCVVAHHVDDEAALYGWAAVQTEAVPRGYAIPADWILPTLAVLWLYVRELYGSQMDPGDPRRVRRRGVGTSLLLGAGVDPSVPTPCRHWSRYGAILASRGYRLYYAPSGAERAA